jgi:thiamine kinase-like enzyme
MRNVQNGSIPERICHNDTKINNILIDEKTSEALCLIDLDTVMPGTVLFEAGRNITQIMGLRFLTDYLEGDQYYRTERPDQNLDRCRTQIALIRSMDSRREEAEALVDELRLEAGRRN